MSNSTQRSMEREETEDHSKIFEQQIFARGVLGYCTHFGIPSKNHYNINFSHFQDFEALYYQEKLLSQTFNLAEENNEINIEPPHEVAKALESILIAKNNYQRIMLQMLDTIYHQEQRLKHMSILLQLHNTVTSCKERYTKNLQDAVAYLSSLTQTPTQSPPCNSTSSHRILHNSISLTDKIYKKDTTKTPRNTSERKKSSVQQSGSNTSHKPLQPLKKNLSIDLASVAKQSKKSSTSCFSQRLRSPNKSSSMQKTYQTPQTKGINTSQQSSLGRICGSGNDEESKMPKRLSYFSRRESEILNSARHDERRDSKGYIYERKMSVKNQKSNHKDVLENGSRRYRNMSCGMTRRNSEDKDVASDMSRDFVDTEVDQRGNKLTEISSIQEDCNDHEYESFKINRAKPLCNNDKMEVTESSSYSYCREETYKVSCKDHKQERLTTECPISTQNKSISFQSSTENPFHDTDNTRANIPEELVLREVSHNKGNCEWPRDIFATSGDQKYAAKPWEFLENNLVTSPSFGIQTVYTEKEINEKNKVRAKVEKFERKDSEQMVLGKVYGSTSLLKKKQWAPLLSKKS